VIEVGESDSNVSYIAINTNENKLKSFKIKTTTMFVDQYYSKYINEINEYIKIKTKNH
jgi:hypothetical protein